LCDPLIALEDEINKNKEKEKFVIFCNYLVANNQKKSRTRTISSKIFLLN
jgi:hypothetical protein